MTPEGILIIIILSLTFVKLCIIHHDIVNKSKVTNLKIEQLMNYLTERKNYEKKN